MDSNPKKRPTIRSINGLITYWIGEIESSDDEDEVKNQFLEADKIKPIIEPSKHSNHDYISKPIDIQEISNKLSEPYESSNDL
ncbi:hypothetical protein F8M41_022939 [Gigaspora margarita]|uniref:Uncharacterized protein n=1 Tax=Gigaspora margarita TaxID=4874 RepID=A0A8H4AEB7_GIGMA|nr:hypothetical protein F8M41_022939 [Gigaspora margarita]